MVNAILSGSTKMRTSFFIKNKKEKEKTKRKNGAGHGPSVLWQARARHPVLFFGIFRWNWSLWTHCVGIFILLFFSFG
jgi:hypothetical protein